MNLQARGSQGVGGLRLAISRIRDRRGRKAIAVSRDRTYIYPLGALTLPYPKAKRFRQSAPASTA